jgi:aquaporin Z
MAPPTADSRSEALTSRRLASEALGTFLLVVGGCGSAAISALFPRAGIGFAGVSLAFGLTVLAGAYAFGPLSGAHFNPAVTVGLAVGQRFAWREVPGYVAAQLLGALAASLVLVLILKGQPGGYDTAREGLAANGYGAHSPGNYSLGAGLLAEVVLTFLFVSVILGCTSSRGASGFAGIPIGLTLTLVHLVGIPVTNVSVNPARSTGPAIFVGGWAIQQLWAFWVAPLVGAALAGALAVWLHAERPQKVVTRAETQVPLPEPTRAPA